MQSEVENDDTLYVILWEFHIRPGMESQFEEAYGPEGEWAAFFRKGEGYVGTELLRDVEHKDRYIVMDVWLSQVAHEAFRRRWLDEYKSLYKVFESLTERETRLGSFLTVGRSKLLEKFKPT